MSEPTVSTPGVWVRLAATVVVAEVVVVASSSPQAETMRASTNTNPNTLLARMANTPGLTNRTARGRNTASVSRSSFTFPGEMRDG